MSAAWFGKDSFTVDEWRLFRSHRGANDSTRIVNLNHLRLSDELYVSFDLLNEIVRTADRLSYIRLHVDMIKAINISSKVITRSSGWLVIYGLLL